MTSATKFVVEVNGKLVTDAAVGIEDQLEINLVSLMEFALRDPDGYCVMISALSAA